MFSENLSIFLADFGTPVVLGAVSGLGILDTPGQVIHNGDVLSVDYCLTCEASKFGGAHYNDSITVNSIPYTIRYVRPVDDGAMVELYLTKI